MGNVTKSGVDYHTLDLQSLSRQVTERSPLPMAAMEGSTHIVRYVNPAFCRLVSRESEELIGVPFARAVPEAGECLPHLDQAYHTGEADTCVVKVRSAPHPLHWSYAIWAVPDASNHPVGVMIQVTDTTKAELFRQNVTAMNQDLMLSSVRQHELTEAAEKLNAELQEAYDRLVEESRERERLNEQLRQAHKMEAIGALAGGIAHDFNNMLAVILGNAELVLDDVEGNYEVRRNIEQIVKASKRARDLVKQILLFSRKNEQGRKPLKLTPLVKETYKLLRGTFPSTIRMDLDIQTGSDTILADPSQIQQVIMNLATNAAHAMRNNGGVLKISLSDVTVRENSLKPDKDMASSGPYVKLSVQDTGTGMTEKVRRRIFEPFFTTKEPGQGTGMGLAVVYGIVKNHDGAVTVGSKKGKGSTFDVFFPHTKVPARKGKEEGGSIPHGTERILLADDEPSIIEVASQTLQRLGYRVTSVRSGAEALRVFMDEPSRFDLLVTDQTMPNLTGIDLAKRILQARKDMPVILFTGYSETVSPDMAKAAGISEFIMKPISKREVAETVRRVLDSRNKNQ